MKKSEAFYLSQIAVVNTPTISPERKIEVLRHLIEQEDFAKFCEKKDENKAATE